MNSRIALQAACLACMLVGCGEEPPQPQPQPAPAPPAAPAAPSAASRQEPAAANAAIGYAAPADVPQPLDAAALEPVVRDRLGTLRTAVQQAPTSGAAWLALADSLLAHAEPTAAAAAYAGALAFLPPDAADRERAAYLRALALENAGDRMLALAELAALAPASKTSQVHWRLGLLLAGEGRMEQALTSAGRAVACDPRDHRARAAVAQIASEMGDWETAEKAARDGLRIAPRNGHLYGILAAARRANGDAAGAEALTGAGRHRAADWLDPWLRDLRELRVSAGAHRERFFEALRASDRSAIAAELLALESIPGATTDSELNLLRAHAALANGDPVLAKSLLAAALDGGAASCEVGLLGILVAAREAVGPAALDPLCEQLQSLPCEGDSDATRLELLASLRLTQRRWDDAATAYVAADEAREAGVGQALLRAAGVMERETAYDAARVVANRLTAVEPLNPQGWLLLGAIELHAGRVAEAQAAAAELAALAPNHPSTKKLLEDIRAASAAPPQR